MKQRLAIASALLNDPEILILDEPTNGLDPQGIHQIRDIIKKIASQGTTILLASHLLDEVEKVCSHVLVLRKGQILYSGLVDQMSKNKNFIELQSDDNTQLVTVLQKHPKAELVQIVEDKVQFYTTETVKTSEINKFLTENNVFVSYLHLRKNSLEEQFLELTGN
jgi:ABC-2 type transport system ATP-binding protein